MPIENEGSATNWTLRFKHGRLTILLFSEPMTPFSRLKSELFDVLRERYPKGLPDPTDPTKYPLEPSKYIQIPESVQDIAFAVPIDQHDTSKGWKQLELSNFGGLRDTPKGLGIKDGGVLAFRFRSEDDVGDELDADADFVVEWPSYDDTYGEAKQGDGEEDMEEA